MKNVYQVITVNKTYGISTVIPSYYCFTSLEDAYLDIKKQISVFEQHNEHCSYEGLISTLDEIANLCFADINNLNEKTTKVYILELEVR